ncbi:EAL domain-containing protein [Skermania piniformis]|uniref:EAL domain-containing protein n=1 Tax=Skermania pinensis TaxID=39122 RepID=A0ABX8SAK0_9ACTN|nr:EAL domain-containing protein [Skermania piniformis]QXQ14890.1 EAL domain-containing protein [Skermania piniformis]
MDAAGYRRFIEHSTDAFVLHDDRGLITDVNRATCRKTGFTRAELLGMQISDVAEISRPEAMAIIAGTEPGHSVLTRTRYRRKDGTLFPVEMNLACQLIDDRKVFFGMAREITARVAAEEAIRNRNDLLNAVMDAAPDRVFVKDEAGRYLFVNAADAALIGRPPTEIIGRDDREILPGDHAESTMADDRRIMASGRPAEIEEHPVVAGEPRIYLANKAPYRDAAGAVIGIIGISRDVTDTRKAEAALQHSEARWQFAIDGAGDGLWDWDLDTGEVFYSRRWAEMLGYDTVEVGGTPAEWTNRVHPDDLSACLEQIGLCVAGRRPDYAFEHRMETKDGSWRWMSARGQVIERDADGRARRIVGMHTDVTERRAGEQAIRELNRRLRWRADHDELSGLLSRSGFIERAAQVLTERRLDGRHLAVLWVDLDAFKRINDSLGHQVGDTVLRTVADRLRAESGPNDLVARLGSDEFVLLRPFADQPDPPDEWAERIRRTLAEPVISHDITLTVTCSIGLVESTADSDDISQLLIDGDLALYQAKRFGRNRIERYTNQLRASQRERADLAGYLRTLIRQGEVLVRYQPIVALDSERMIGAEALARMPAPDGGELSPAEFLPHLEALGLLTDLAMLMVERACADFADQPDLGWVSVNLTSADLADPELPEQIAAALDRSGLDPARLVLEINEQVVPEPHILGAVQRLTELGARVALDDFGTGWSSLAQLRDLDLGLVKIDRSVVVAATTRDQPQLSAMLTAALAMARALDLDVIAEGIERTAESQTVAGAGTQFGQGYLWQPALDLDKLLRWSRSRNRAAWVPATAATRSAMADHRPGGESPLRIGRPGATTRR